MNSGKAVSIFKHIKHPVYSIEEKGLAIKTVLEMPTLNSITKDDMKTVIDFLWNEIFEFKKSEDLNNA